MISVFVDIHTFLWYIVTDSYQGSFIVMQKSLSEQASCLLASEFFSAQFIKAVCAKKGVAAVNGAPEKIQKWVLEVLCSRLNFDHTKAEVSQILECVCQRRYELSQEDGFGNKTVTFFHTYLSFFDLTCFGVYQSDITLPVSFSPKANDLLQLMGRI